MKPQQLFFGIVVLTIATLIISLPKNIPVKFNLFGQKINYTISSPEINIKIGKFQFVRDLNIRKGLDLQGGTQVVLKADMAQVPSADRQTALESVKDVINRRVDLYGVTEPTIQTSKVNDEYRVLVELPGVSNVGDAIQLIGQTAQLDFRVLPENLKNSTTSASLAAFVKTDLTGKDLKRANVQFGQGSKASSGPTVGLQFSDEGAKKFAEITKNNVGKPVAIFLDNMPVTVPVVNEAITSGQAVISGNFTTDSAKELTIQLNAGALPVPVSVIEQRSIGPNLGQDSVNKSIIAGVVGLSIVMAFMIANYGKLGLIADVGLIVYGLITLSIYKLVPITLTLPGIAGFILSVGMAVDANILIFERMKEETRSGRPWRQAMELGFGRAWTSIKDANVCTILTALVLLNPLNLQFLVTSGMVRGFALTLLIGVLVSLFTGIVVTRALLRVLYKGEETNNTSLQNIKLATSS
jgi:preprotein translocase subunit SecD